MREKKTTQNVINRGARKTETASWTHKKNRDKDSSSQWEKKTVTKDAGKKTETRKKLSHKRGKKNFRTKEGKKHFRTKEGKKNLHTNEGKNRRVDDEHWKYDTEKKLSKDCAKQNRIISIFLKKKEKKTTMLKMMQSKYEKKIPVKKNFLLFLGFIVYGWVVHLARLGNWWETETFGDFRFRSKGGVPCRL